MSTPAIGGPPSDTSFIADLRGCTEPAQTLALNSDQVVPFRSFMACLGLLDKSTGDAVRQRPTLTQTLTSGAVSNRLTVEKRSATTPVDGHAVRVSRVLAHARLARPFPASLRFTRHIRGRFAASFRLTRYDERRFAASFQLTRNERSLSAITERYPRDARRPYAASGAPSGQPPRELSLDLSRSISTCASESRFSRSSARSDSCCARSDGCCARAFTSPTTRSRRRTHSESI